MGLDNDLSRLGVLLREAADDLQQAARIAETLAHHDDEHDVPDWPAMARLLNTLQCCRSWLELEPPPEVQAAIEQADRRLDELSDMADGQLY